VYRDVAANDHEGLRSPRLKRAARTHDPLAGILVPRWPWNCVSARANRRDPSKRRGRARRR